MDAGSRNAVKHREQLTVTRPEEDTWAHNGQFKMIRPFGQRNFAPSLAGSVDRDRCRRDARQAYFSARSRTGGGDR